MDIFMKYLVLDLETSITEKFGRKANPWFNGIVVIGTCSNGNAKGKILSDMNCTLNELMFNQLWQGKKIDTLVFHNAKFDMLYLWECEALQHWISSGGKIWDTMLCEFLMSGQQHKYPALRDIAVNKYGCKSREKVMEKYWDNTKCVVDSSGRIVEDESQAYEEEPIYAEPNGDWLDIKITLRQGYKEVTGPIDTKDIPKDLVLVDVTNDVLDTEQIYLQQLVKAEELGMTKIIEHHCEALLATIEMEHNGLYVDKAILHSNRQVLEIDLKDTQNQYLELAKRYWK